MKNRTLNVKPFHVETSCSTSGFVLKFFCDDDKVVKLHFDYWWIGYIAEALWKCIHHQDGIVESNRRAMKRDEK